MKAVLVPVWSRMKTVCCLTKKAMIFAEAGAFSEV